MMRSLLLLLGALLSSIPAIAGPDPGIRLIYGSRVGGEIDPCG
jgi:hypothetical protein